MSSLGTPSGEISVLRNVRLPRWTLPLDWPTDARGQVVLADVTMAQGRITTCQPSASGQLPGATNPQTQEWDAQGALALPGLVDAHTHLDKTFTLDRVNIEGPGLLAAIAAMHADHANWTEQDIRCRAEKALHLAWRAGVTHLRTHVDWWEVSTPTAWSVLAELAQEWAPRLHIERIALIPQFMFADAAVGRQLAREVARSGPGALMGGFVHSTHWSAETMEGLMRAAAEAGLNMDLHVDEELNPQAQGLATIARLAKSMQYQGRIVCGHVCALAAQTEQHAFDTLDAVAQVPITLVALPITNLLLQDAVTGRTPRQRGLTLVKEAKARDIPVLMASDNVEDPFCAVGSYDPVEALSVGAMVAQLPEIFDDWSQSLCRTDWLKPGKAAGWGHAPSLIGKRADWVLFPQTQAYSWPARSQKRLVIRAGVPVWGFSNVAAVMPSAA